MTLTAAGLHLVTPGPDDAAGFLLRDRPWGAYPLGYLDPIAGTRLDLHAAADDGAISGLVTIAHLPNLLNLFATGEPAAVGEVLRRLPRLPASGVFSAQAEVLDAMERHLQVTTAYRMQRMIVRPGGLRRKVTAQAVRLSVRNLDQVRRLYGMWTDSHQLPGQLTTGIYYGVFVGSELVAAAGTHALSSRFGVGAIGNVLTHISYRGRGLASTTTTAVAEDLFDRGIEDVVLNVRQGNDIAMETYRKLGFTDYCTFIEGVFRKR